MNKFFNVIRFTIKRIYFFVMCLILVVSISACQQVINSDTLTPYQRCIKVPLTRQAKDYTCGVAATQSILGYYGDDYRQDVLEQDLKTTQDGTSYKDIESFAISLGYSVDVFLDMTEEQLRSNLDQRMPVMLQIQAWADNLPADYKNDWDDGHWVIAVGYDSDNYYFMDPSTLGNYTYIPRTEFPDRWHDVDNDGTQLIHFGMIIKRGQPVFVYDTVTKMD